ncbi:flagellar protein export ATPase FliI [Texcoconibacillus texcoconensis]|uniref:Flagellum-specific ATP synthase n=1 Tax=Texcoconibacillus texcoconensis TaxID=1095777 RepID=A0A840QL40_9BACI|nr:flagellar protein export ATPase FliI [Texcoconibacillus texcoconensis]MBB5172077.1 flagellum-specific ATP synthase [Texcoconibacillus texcoconensis]
MAVETLIHDVDQINPYKHYGKVTQVVGLMIESKGPQASVGDLCYILVGKQSRRKIMVEVVGFKGEHVLLMPFDNVEEIAPGSLVEATRAALQVKVGASLIGRVVDGIGRPLEGEQPPNGLTPFPTNNRPPNPLSRPRITEPLSLGVRAIDSLFTVGKGQRVGIFAGSGVGKSTMMAMIAKNSEADINVIALIGERGREVRDFIERDLGEEGLKNTIVVVATSDQPALMRIKGALTATAIAEFFRNQGQNVNLMMDSVTRVAMAQREVGLAVGEPPTTKGYTPSVFSILPQLLERSGTNGSGTITAFYTVLVDGDDLNEPIADAVRGILDGHLVLDRELANKGQFPAINVLNSVSRVMNDVVSDQQKKAADRLRNLLATYHDNEDLINIGAYKRGSNKELDKAIKLQPKITSFLKQETDESVTYDESVTRLINEFTKGE